ncbi:MAG: SGNH/GDSL hydrolase family protein [bacterium]|nr:SGNH/GDSL hydrolase family protein [bacterium]
MHPRSLSRKLIYSLVLFVFFLGFIEGTARVALFLTKSDAPSVGIDQRALNVIDTGFKDSVYAEVDPVLGYRLKRNHSVAEYHFNSLGFRGPDFEEKKPPGVFRIICIGGSTTIGSNAGGDHLTYPAILEQLFSKAETVGGKRVEVINAGVFGYNSWHHRLRTSSELDALDPDLYVFMMGLNDVVGAMRQSRTDLQQMSANREAALTALLNRKPSMLREVGSWVRQTGIGRVMDSSGKWLVTKMNSHQATPQDIENQNLNESQVEDVNQRLTYIGFEENMKVLIKERKQKGIPVVLVNYPWIVKGDTSVAEEKSRGHNISNEFLWIYRSGRVLLPDINQRLARSEQIPLVDPQALFDRETQKKGTMYRVYSDSVHFSRYGNYLLAKEVYETIRQTPKLASAIQPNPLLPVEQVADQFSNVIDWLPLYTAGWFDSPEGAPKVEVLSTQNLTYQPNKSATWGFYTPTDLQQNGVIRVKMQLGTLRQFDWIVYPRLSQKQESVTIILKTAEANQSIFHFSSPTDGEWSPLQAAYLVDQSNLSDLNRASVELEIQIKGSVQYWTNSKREPFYFLALNEP